MTPTRHVRNLSVFLFIMMHASLITVLFVPVSGKVIALAGFGYLIRMFGITAGYHRYFSHRSFKTSRAFQFVLAVFGLLAMQNGPLWWSSWHRRHHKYSDTPQDPHSLRSRGFYHAHMGWIFDSASDSPDFSNIKDLTVYPELQFLDRHKWFPLVAYAIGCFAVAGLSGLVWGFLVSTILALQSTMLINSLAHMWGSRPYETTDDSRNNMLLALLTLGEGWHNNHHYYMSSVRQGFRWWQIDITYYVLRGLALVGIVWDLRLPPRHVLDAARREPEPLEAMQSPQTVRRS